MLILTKKQNRIVNSEYISLISISSESGIIRADIPEINDYCTLGVYATNEEAMQALKMLYEGLAQGCSVAMPDEKQVQAKLIIGQSKYDRYKGHKTKSHGGS